MASGPASAPRRKLPPRSSAPGSPVVAAPARYWRSPVGLTPALHVPDSESDRGSQSATHSCRLPTMSNAPCADTQLAREPVGVGSWPDWNVVLQSVVPSSDPGSGVPTTAACHSALVGSRLRALLHAVLAGNHVL